MQHKLSPEERAFFRVLPQRNDGTGITFMSFIQILIIAQPTSDVDLLDGTFSPNDFMNNLKG